VHKDTAGTSDHVFTVFPLEIPNATNIRKVQDYIDDGNRYTADIGSQKGGEGEYVPLREALWVCSQEFHSKSQSKKVNEYRRVWLFTNDDHPNAHSLAEQDKIVKVARDCAETGIELSLWHMNSAPGKAFNPSLFYEKLLQATAVTDAANKDGAMVEEEDVGVEHRMRGGGDEGFDLMLASVRRKHHRKRKLRTMTMSLGASHSNPESFIAVTLYRLVSLTKKPQYKWLYARTNEPLTVSSKYISGETGDVLDESNIVTYLEVSGSRIEFDTADMKNIKSCNALVNTAGGPGVAVAANAEELDADAPGGADITLLYCAPVSVLAADANVECAYFLFPDNSTTTGSAAVFSALLTELLEKQLIGMARFRRMKNGAPRLAALLPQPEILDDDGIQVQAPGFNVIVLPFMEEIRRNPAAGAGCVPEVLEPTQNADCECVQAAINFIRSAQLDDNFIYYRDVENPALQQFHRWAACNLFVMP
jgi:ATP-dependent DNA helicase 2 subunit 1